jgi:hypothetical protein
MGYYPAFGEMPAKRSFQPLKTPIELTNMAMADQSGGCAREDF